MQNKKIYHELGEHMTLPLIPLTGVVFAYPRVSITIDVVTPSIRNAIESSERSGSPVFIVTQKNPFAVKVETNNLYEVGTVAKIKQIIKLPNGNMKVSVEALYRAKIVEFKEVKPNFAVTLEYAPYIPCEEENTVEAYFRKAKNSSLLPKIIEACLKLPFKNLP